MAKHKPATTRCLPLTVLVCLLIAMWLRGSAAAEMQQTPPPPAARQLLRDASVTLRNIPAEDAPSAADGSYTTNSVADAEIMQGYPAAGCGNQLMLHIGYDDTMSPEGKIMRGLVKFNLATIPARATINSAQLQLYLAGSWDYPDTSRTVTSYRIASPWMEDLVTWSNAPALAEAYGSATVTHGIGGWYSFDVTGLVRGWQSGAFANYGIGLRGPEQSGSDSSWRAFAAGATTYSPRLVVNWTSAGASESRALSDLDANVAPSHGRRVSIGDFGLTVDPSYRTISPGAGVSYTASISPTEGFANPVTLTVGGLPGQTSYRWNANPVTPPGGSLKMPSILDITTTVSTPPGSYTLVITGASADITHTASVTLTVRPFQVYLPIILRQKPPVPYNTLALIIGISNYEHMGPPPGGVRAGSPGYNLIQPARDRDNMVVALSMLGCQGVLASQFTNGQAAGCPLANIRVLNDSQATKANIRQAINWLNDLANSDTTIIIYFSGHGMTDGTHGYIVPYDVDCNPCGSTPETTRWLPETAISDDELASWLSQLDSQRVVLIFDSCYSGGMMDPAGNMARGLSASDHVGALQANAGLLAYLSTPGRVALMASAADQGSWEFSALKNGAFTYYLIEALLSPAADTNHNGRVSAEEAFAYLVGRVDNYVFGHTSGAVGGPYHQNPQIYDGVPGEVDLTQPATIPGVCPVWPESSR